MGGTVEDGGDAGREGQEEVWAWSACARPRSSPGPESRRCATVLVQ